MQDRILPDHGSGHQPDRSRQQLDAGAARPPGTGAGWKNGPELHALGRTVRELRARLGLSQERLGAAAGTHRNYIGAIERGEINPTFRVLLNVLHGLQVPLVELATVYERHRRIADSGHRCPDR
jgi:DNA-binding XRE family transcriptional regulator